MRSNRSLLLVVLLLVLITTKARAGETWLFAGGNLSYLSTTTDYPLEVNKSGVEANLKLVGSRYFDQAIVDLGAGWAFSSVKGDTSATQNIQVITRSFFAELSPRYRIDADISIGPLLQFFSGDDVSYDENAAVNELRSHWRLGARAEYDIGNSPRYRIGLQAVTDLNIPNRKIATIGIDFQIGFSPGKEIISSAAPIVEAAPIKPAFAQQANDRSIRLYLGEAMLSFKPGGYKLSAKANEALARLAPVLLRNQDAWNKMRVEGHTDAKIGKTDNQVLSERRARAVEKELVALKLPAEKISTQGFAATKPIDPSATEEAYILNRRVEIWIDDVKPDQIRKMMAELNQLQ